MTMLDNLKKTVLAGMGAAGISKDKVRASLEELVAQGKITAAEARAAADRIAAEGRLEFEKASTRVAARVKELSAYTDGEYVRRIKDLEARVASLETRARKRTKKKA